jgi:formylglycine-generating enzyme required for sulfatase activity
MKHHGASNYCQWLSAVTGHFYRLPTEAEWEYDCRAGTDTAYSFEEEPRRGKAGTTRMDDHARYEWNSDFAYQKVGQKQPNRWGLHDMHGDVMEWCLDQMSADYTRWGTFSEDPWVRATRPYPHVLRGGSFDDPAEWCRSAARRGSDPDWKMTDPQLPKNVWWLTDIKTVGFRVVRLLDIPPPEEMANYWNSGVEWDEP